MGTKNVDTGNKIVAIGYFDAQAGAPAWFGQKGFTAAVTRNAAGNYDLTLDRPHSAPNTSTHVFGAETEAATRSTRFAATRPSDTVIRVTTMQETGGGGGGASAAADKDFWIVVMRRPAG